MDIMNLLTKKDTIDFLNTYSYPQAGDLSALFSDSKSKNMKARVAYITNGNTPVMAQFHALDSEAKIADRKNYAAVEYEKLLIKSKINQDESLQLLLAGEHDDEAIIKHLFNDQAMLSSMVFTRVYAADLSALAFGKVVIDENEVKTVIDWHTPAQNFSTATGWALDTHDIIADISAVLAKASENGTEINYAITSAKIIGYLVKNKAIREAVSGAGLLPTKTNIIEYLFQNFNIRFVTEDKKYLINANDTTKHRFFPENKISFVYFDGVSLVENVYGVTAEELALSDTMISSYTAVSYWNTPDPVALWTKAAATVIPVLKDPNGLFVLTVAA